MITMTSPHRRRVRVWFGEHAIADYIAEPELAGMYEKAMKRRFAGLRVSNDLVPLTGEESTRLT